MRSSHGLKWEECIHSLHPSAKHHFHSGTANSCGPPYIPWGVSCVRAMEVVLLFCVLTLTAARGLRPLLEDARRYD